MQHIIELRSRLPGCSYKVDTSDPFSYTNGYFDLRAAVQCNPAGERDCLVKTTLKPEHVPLLSRESFLLNSLYESATTGDKADLHLEEYFPTIIENLKLDNGNTSLVLSIGSFASKLSEALVLSRVVASSRVDPRTAAWITTRLLRLVMFLSENGYFHNTLVSENIMLCPGIQDIVGHKLLIFDWTGVESTNAFDQTVSRSMLMQVGLAVLQALNGHPKTGKLPPHDDLVDDRFQMFLRNLALGNHYDPSQAYKLVYSIIDDYWKRGFHPYTTLPRITHHH